jgi:hypothetical protein
MHSNLKLGRITGALLLFVFISGVVIFQVLQGPVLFSDQYLTATAAHSDQVISSMVLGIFNGIVSIAIATILLPTFKKYHRSLAYLYFAFCILNFISIMIDNVSVASLLELSKTYGNGSTDESLVTLGALAYERHFWTHYFYLLISCFPVLVFYYMLYLSRLVPKILSVFGLVAVLLMFIEELASIYGSSISMNMLLPIGLVQLVLPVWLLIKGFSTPKSAPELAESVE